jgi:hypothetical protein
MVDSLERCKRLDSDKQEVLPKVVSVTSHILLKFFRDLRSSP